MTAVAWDRGLTWRSRRTVEPADVPVSLTYISQQVLRVANGSVDDDHVLALIKAATEEAEDYTQRALMPQTWELVSSGFPESNRGIVLPRPPLIDIVSFAYYDSAGDLQSLAVSPAAYRLVASGKVTKAELWPLENESWPATQTRPDAVTVTFEAGYPEVPGFPGNSVPHNILAGIGLMVGELYKQRTLSVHTVRNTPAVLQVERFWKRVY
jgi:uncharacterized phiE125 gp8 family phage protein